MIVRERYMRLIRDFMDKPVTVSYTHLTLPTMVRV